MYYTWQSCSNIRNASRSLQGINLFRSHQSSFRRNVDQDHDNEDEKREYASNKYKCDSAVECLDSL